MRLTLIKGFEYLFVKLFCTLEKNQVYAYILAAYNRRLLVTCPNWAMHVHAVPPGGSIYGHAISFPKICLDSFVRVSLLVAGSELENFIL